MKGVRQEAYVSSVIKNQGDPDGVEAITRLKRMRIGQRGDRCSQVKGCEEREGAGLVSCGECRVDITKKRVELLVQTKLS